MDVYNYDRHPLSMEWKGQTRIYHRMICGLHIEADEGLRWWNENNDLKLEEDHSMVRLLLQIRSFQTHVPQDGTFRLYLNDELQDEGFGFATYVPRNQRDAYYDFLAVTEQFVGDYPTDHEMSNSQVTDETHMVPGNTPEVDRMKKILDRIGKLIVPSFVLGSLMITTQRRSTLHRISMLLPNRMRATLIPTIPCNRRNIRVLAARILISSTSFLELAKFVFCEVVVPCASTRASLPYYYYYYSSIFMA